MVEHKVLGGLQLNLGKMRPDAARFVFRGILSIKTQRLHKVEYPPDTTTQGEKIKFKEPAGGGAIHVSEIDADRDAGVAARDSRIAVGFLLLLTLGVLAAAQAPSSQVPTNGNAVVRGKYLVEGVARCGQCHTPRDNNKNYERAHWLQGAPVPWLPAKPESDWPITAPRIGGTPLPASDADMVKLLMTGIWTTGTNLRPPMPQFRMSQADAAAVVAYLKSLNPQP